MIGIINPDGLLKIFFEIFHTGWRESSLIPVEGMKSNLIHYGFHDSPAHTHPLRVKSIDKTILSNTLLSHSHKTDFSFRF